MLRHPFLHRPAIQSDSPAGTLAESLRVSTNRRSFFGAVAAAMGAGIVFLLGRSSSAQSGPSPGYRESRQMTTQAVGEEGGGRMTTQAVGEEGGGRLTTQAVGEEGGGRVTTQAVGEEGAGWPGGGGRVTTYAVGEEGGYYNYRPVYPRYNPPRRYYYRPPTWR